jgi:Ca2+-binding EF-hand superfamily protein
MTSPIPIRSMLVAATLCAVAGLATAFGQPPTATTSELDRFDLLVFAPNHPVIVRFQVRIGTSGITAYRRRYTDQLFRTLDSKRDGLLSRSEVTRVERLGEIASRFRALTRTWKDFDTEPADNHLSPDEFSRVVQGALGTPFEVRVQSRSATRSAELFTRLDHDSDGLLTASEVSNGAQQLRRLDLDDDHTFSLNELDPLQYESTRPESRHFVALANANHRLLADRLIARYTTTNTAANTAANSQTIATSRTGLAPAQAAKLDLDGDGRLNRSELTAYLAHPTPHETINASLPDPRTNRTRLEVIGGPSSRGLARLSRSWGGPTVQLRAKNARSDRLLTTKFYRLRFFVADVNKNRYIEPTEFPQLMLTAASFAMVDADNNGKLTRDELTEFIKDQTAVQQSRLLLNVTHKSRSLFQLLDSNGDRRLAPREFRDGYERLKPLDTDRNGHISRTELSGEYVLTLEVARAALFSDDAMAMPAPQVTRTTPTTETRTGPAWFQRMDRNGDGDVSDREFLGGLALFKRLDRNGDGLISVREVKELEPTK